MGRNTRTILLILVIPPVLFVFYLFVYRQHPFYIESQHGGNDQLPSHAIVDYLLEVSLGTEYGGFSGSEEVVVKWVKPEVGIEKHGLFNQFLEDCLGDVIEDFNSLSLTTKLHVIEDGGEIDMYLEPKEKFEELLPEYVPGNDGFGWMRWNQDYEITQAIILINSNDHSKDIERCHLIREELTQVMGMAKDSYKYNDSIFYARWTTTLNYSQIDEEVIKIMYNPSIKPGMTRNDVEDRSIKILR